MARKWPWPKEATPVAQPNSTNWIERHPTEYGLDADVKQVAYNIFGLVGMQVRVNTYTLHPEYDYVPGRVPATRSWAYRVGYNTQRRSIDTWGAGGRGAPVGSEVGTKVAQAVFNDPNPPYFDWLIWRGRIYTPERGWEVWNSDGTGLHFDHPHMTFSPTRTSLIPAHLAGLAPTLEHALAELEEGWEDDREEQFWASRPDDGKHVVADGLWVPV